MGLDSGNAWTKVKVSDSHRNNQEAGERCPGKIIIFSISALSDKADGSNLLFFLYLQYFDWSQPASQPGGMFSRL